MIPDDITIDDWTRLTEDQRRNAPQHIKDRLKAELDAKAAGIKAQLEAAIGHDIDADQAFVDLTATNGQKPHTDEPNPREAFHSQFIVGDRILDLPPPKPLVGTWIDREAIVVMPGPFGCGKTHLLVDLALAVATGKPWLNQPVHHTGPVWFFIGEGVYTIGDRVRTWQRRHETWVLPDNVKFYPHTLHLDRVESAGQLLDAVDHLDDDGIDPPVLIVIDTWSRYISGAEVPDITKPALAAIEHIRDHTGTTTVIATHTGHNVTGRSRGDSTLEDNADIVIPLMGRLRDERGTTQAIEMVNTKQKARATQPPMWIKLQEMADPDATSLEPNKTLAWVEPVAGPDDDDRESKDEIAIGNAELKIAARARMARQDVKTKSAWVEESAVNRQRGLVAFSRLVDKGLFVPEGDEFRVDKTSRLYSN